MLLTINGARMVLEEKVKTACAVYGLGIVLEVRPARQIPRGCVRTMK